VMLWYGHPAAAPFAVQARRAGEGALTLSWSAPAGRRYEVAAATAPGAWQTVATLLSTGAPPVWTTPITGEGHWFQVRSAP
ncbi:MAG TPA: hypothetical protein PKE47_05100, partial [Verrucomicrobiota bacterium]|nr:hypothetical protein [Verrucomicrobiota bacterium]